MREESITLTTRDQKRVQVLNRVLAGQWTPQEAALALGLSVRQVRRLRAGYAQEGVAAVVHGNRGRPPVHTLPLAVREQIVALARTTYAGFNHQHLTEKLVAAEGLAVSRPTVRRLLVAAGLPSPRPRRAPKHRQRRERLPRAGLLLQADGSRHRWLGPEGPYFTLIGGIDDATGTVPWALFREQEDAHGYMAWLAEVARREGLPHALYVDRHGVFQRRAHEPWTREEELAGSRLPTQFGRVLEELAIRPIYALSPQAKGRIERLWGTFQDRLVSELRLVGAQTLADANAVLGAYLPQFNARFAVPPAQAESAYRPLPPDFRPERVFCFKYLRTVGADNTVRLGEHCLQLRPGPERASYARARVEIHERLDGSLAVYYADRWVATQPAPPEAPVLRARSHRTGRPVPAAPAPAGGPAAVVVEGGGKWAGAAEAVHLSPPPPRPAADHPWRRSYKTGERTKSEIT
jgi:Winged helix-turn helix